MDFTLHRSKLLRAFHSHKEVFPCSITRISERKIIRIVKQDLGNCVKYDADLLM